MAMLCRTCGQQVHALNSKHLFDEDGMEIIRNIEILTGILITSQADMPENICVNCLLDVNNAIDFRERCIQMHNHLLEQYAAKDVMEQDKQERKSLISIEDEQDTKEPPIEDYNDLIYEVNEEEDELLLCSPAAQSIQEVEQEDDEDEPQMTAEDYALIYDEEVQEEEVRSQASNSLQVPGFRPRKRIPSSERKPPPKRKKPTEPFFCDQCGKSFWEKGNLVVHMKRHDAKQYECPECGRKEFTAHLLNLHIRIKHKGELPYECKYCGQRFDNSLKRLKHERVIHIKYVFPRPFKCQICDKSFKDKTSFAKHGSIHSGEKPHQCEVCQTSFNQKRTLINHYRSKQHIKNYEALKER
ncbi:transcription factor Ouib-like [Drosophila tropicalis]|uniref:transcription factor Ouib-like n=1 Tax=Drosophila tropicalis TaxID=46794 RepID=UPI0035AB7A56